MMATHDSDSAAGARQCCGGGADHPRAPGPTDRDGNNPLGITSASYRLLAEALAEQGVSSVRIDKRGMFGSKAR